MAATLSTAGAVTVSRRVSSGAVTRPLPESARLAWWGTAWLRGQVAPDDLMDAVIGEDATHTAGPGEGLLTALGRLRVAGAHGLGLALPAAGDPVGIGGPRELTEAALAAGQAVVAVGAPFALVPERVGAAVSWRVLDALPRQLTDLGDADRELRRTTLAAADSLAALAVARWRPEVADLLLAHSPAPVPAPPGIPPRCVDLAGRGLRALQVVELALADDGAAVSGSEAELRRDALLPLERAGRRAVVAACSPEAWPPERRGS
jgi:hypothetical protein